MIKSPCFTCQLSVCDDTSPQCPLSTQRQKPVSDPKPQSKHRSTEWRRKHPEQARATAKAWRQANQEKVAASFKAYRDKNRERVLQWQRDRRARLKQQCKK